MSDLGTWLSRREPAPPMSLRRWVEGVEGENRALVDALLTAAGAALEAARAGPGRVRASAFHLLAADALLTYACEAGLESDDPGAALQRILSVGWLQ